MRNYEDIEYFIIKGLIYDLRYSIPIIKEYSKRYFVNNEAKIIFGIIQTYIQTHGDVPKSTDVVINESPYKQKENVSKFLDKVRELDFDLVNNAEYLIKETERHLKENAIKNAILDCVEIIDKNEDNGKINDVILIALLKSIRTKENTDFYKSITSNIDILLNTNEIKVPSYFYTLDEITNGGFSNKTLSVFLAPIHSWKSQTLINMAFRQTCNGKNVLIFTLEMSKEMYEQRIFALMADMDVNSVIDKRYKTEFLKRTLSFIKERKNIGKEFGELYITEMPTGVASILDIKRAIKEYELRDNKFDIILIDYLNLMKPAYKHKTDLYMDLKIITEEVRSLAITNNVPIVSATQFNRDGMRKSLKDMDMTYVGESLGIPATADFMCILGNEIEERQMFENQKLYKIVKNRLGGRIGEMNSFYLDKRSLKMFDSTEENIWMEIAKITKDTRGMIHNGYGRHN